MDDLFRTEELFRAVVAPDGRAAAFELRRAPDEPGARLFQKTEARSDIWIQLEPNGKARNLTNGRADNVGAWQPRWSPRAERLVYLSTRGGRVTPWVWERKTESIRQVTRDGIDGDNDNGGCRWADEYTLICLGQPDDEPATTDDYVGLGMERAKAAWAKAVRGEVTASVVNSVEFPVKPRNLLSIDLRTGKQQVLAVTTWGNYAKQTWWVSREARAIVYVQAMPSAYSVAEQMQMGEVRSIGVVKFDGTPLRISAPLPDNVISHSIAFAPGQMEMIFFAYGDKLLHPEVLYGEQRAKDLIHQRPATKDNPATLWRLRIDTGHLEQIRTGDLDLGSAVRPPAFQVLADGELLFRATRLSAAVRGEAPSLGWLVLGRDGHVRTLLREGDAAPQRLQVVEQGRTAVGWFADDVWRVDVQSGRTRNLTAALDPAVQDVGVLETAPSVWRALIRAGTPRQDDLSAEMRQLRLRSGQPVDGVESYLLDLSTGAATRITLPKATAFITDVTERAGQATVWFRADDKSGTYIWRGVQGTAHDLMMVANIFRRDIKWFEERIIDYTGGNGEPLKARIVLPADYSPSRRYPLVVDSDIGYTPSTSSSNFDLAERADEPTLDRDDGVFAGAGYVYMFTSAPTLTGMDKAGRANLLMLAEGILPAVQKVIDLGIADPDRLFLYGISSFGYGVFGLVTQTSRFKAAVAQAGWVDQTALSLSTAALSRYTNTPFSSYVSPRYSTSVLPFWHDAELARRNSPLAYVDRVQTPLMIIHGDLDILPIWQPEMFFTALVQQRKPAQFVRYFGEGHGNQSRANLRDSYQRILAWFDRYGDVLRDSSGRIVFDGAVAKTRGAARVLEPAAYARFTPFVPYESLPAQVAAAR